MYRILVVLLVAMAMGRLIGRWRQGEMTTRRFAAWAVVWLAALLLGMLPELSTHITGLLGVGRGADLFFFFSILFLVYLLFGMHIRMERMQCELTALVRELALRELPDAPAEDGRGKPRG